MKVEDLMDLLKKANPQDYVRFYSLKFVDNVDTVVWQKEQLFIEDCSKSEKGLEILFR